MSKYLMETNLNWSKEKPFYSNIITCRELTPPQSKKKTLHISLNLENSQITYRPGDCIGILPTNSPFEVQKIIKILGNSTIESPYTGECLSLESFLLTKANISSVSKKLIQHLVDIQRNETKKEELQSLLSDKQKFKERIPTYRLWDFLEQYFSPSLKAQDLANKLTRLLPRLYSIASSQNHVGNEVHLTVALVDYTNQNKQRLGVCSRFLYESNNEQPIPIYLQKTRDFLLPENPSKDLIMIGPGTGIAPFRAFMQERLTQSASGKHWLFFGDWHENEHFYYKEEWLPLVKNKKLRIDTAFSRDQDHKIYVQDKMKEYSQELWQWLQNGACLYVCGDASKMAKDVDLALQEIAQAEGNLSEEDAKAYLKQLRKEHRYLRDIY
jgi:sulfite reductase (NADPH) flavoprotein alpha-component